MSVSTDPTTGEVVIAGMGELHLEIILDRLKREFKVEASVGRPQVAYKETLTRQADGEGRLARQSGGRGQYAHAKVHLYPGEPGSGYVFESAIIGGAIPTEFIKPIDEGIAEALTRGVLAGCPVDDVSIVLYDGSYHDVDSSELTFKIAGSMAFHDAAKRAKPVLMEPIMRVEVTAPTECLGDVIGNLSSRRGQIQSHDDCDGMQRIRSRTQTSGTASLARRHGIRSCRAELVRRGERAPRCGRDARRRLREQKQRRSSRSYASNGATSDDAFSSMRRRRTNGSRTRRIGRRAARVAWSCWRSSATSSRSVGAVMTWMGSSANEIRGVANAVQPGAHELQGVFGGIE
jgi:hypothetical protein